VNLKEIRQECWSEARETATNDVDRLWTTADMTGYINRIYRFIARETRCIRDTITPSVCRITCAPPADLAALTTLAATDSWAAQDLGWYNGGSDSWLTGQLVAPYSFPLSSLVLEVEECKFATHQWKLTKVSIAKWQTNPWWEQVVGMPTEYATDGDNNRLFVNFRFTAADVLKLAVRRLPLANLVVDGDSPEFRTSYHDFLKNGVLSLMYLKHDSQTFDPAKSADYEGKFKLDLDEIKQQESILDRRLRVNSSLEGFR